MNKKILVPLGQYDRSEEMIPYIEKVARPGMKVVFLMRYPVDGFIWGKEEYGMKAALDARKLVNYYSWDGNLEKAKQQIAPACEALRANGIEAAMEVYAGSLKKAARSHMLNGDVHLIMVRAGIGDWMAKLFDGTTSVFKWFRLPSFSPVMLINPRTIVWWSDECWSDNSPRRCRALQSRMFKSFKWFKTFKSIPDIFNGLNGWNLWNDWNPREISWGNGE
jgi:hypothetical protein